MSYSKSLGEYEVELPGEWPPCDQCGSTVRVAVATMQHRNIGFFCAEMHRSRWEEDNGNTGLWIRHDHFWAGGQFEGVMPEIYLTVPKAKDRDRRFEINERRADWIHHEQSACVVCGVPPMRDYHDGRKLYWWLNQHHPDVFNNLNQIINVMTPRPTYSTWLAQASREHPAFIGEIMRRVRDSLLQADYGIPKAALDALWDQWDRRMRMAATNTLAFGYCRPHNNGKSERLPSHDELLRLHIQINFRGKENVARADTERWNAVQRVANSIEAYRPKYTASNKSTSRGSTNGMITAPVATDEEL